MFSKALLAESWRNTLNSLVFFTANSKVFSGFFAFYRFLSQESNLPADNFYKPEFGIKKAP